MLTRLSRLLRSRRLTVGLLVAICAYAFVVTLIPQGAPDTPAVVDFIEARPLVSSLTVAFGLHRAFAHPVFLLMVFIFTASTVACSWERSRAIRTVSVAWRRGDEQFLGRFATSKGLIVDLPPAIGCSEALGHAESAVRDLGLRPVRSGDDALWAHGRWWGVFGSPLFHWALAALFVFAGLGQLTKWEGVLGVMEGQTVADEPDAYRNYARGPFSTHPTGRTIIVNDLDTNHTHAGIERGPAPLVVLSKDGRDVAEQRVFPNNPLQYGHLDIHQSEYAIAALLGVVGADGDPLGSAQAIFEYDSISPDGRLIVEIEVEGRPGEVYDAFVAVRLDELEGKYFRRIPESRKAEVTFRTVDGSPIGQTLSVPTGDRVALPNESGWLVVEDLGDYVWLFMAEDWSIPYIYAALILACVGATIALMLPPRAVYVRHERFDDGRARLVLVPRHRRVDPAFPGLVHRAVSSAIAKGND